MLRILEIRYKDVDLLQKTINLYLGPLRTKEKSKSEICVVFMVHHGTQYVKINLFKSYHNRKTRLDRADPG